MIKLAQTVEQIAQWRHSGVWKARSQDDIYTDMLGHISPSAVHRYVKHSRAYYDQAIDRVVAELLPTPTPTEATPDGHSVDSEEVARG